ncbi:MAG: glycosyl hydrolase, partial [Saprospiraceae bacterium]
LLFAGTEFGLFITVNGGKTWTQIKNGLPTIAVRDLEIHRKKNDLVIATFGRGFWILENYAILRHFDKKNLDKSAFIYPVEDALMFNPWQPLGLRDKGFQGQSYYAAANPVPGATIIYNVKEDIKTLKEKRKDSEKEKIKKGEPVYYPSIDSLRLEDNEPEPYVLATITDEAGDIVRRIKLPAKKGNKQFIWDLRSAPVSAVTIGAQENTNIFANAEKGYPVLPGKYKVDLSKFENGKYIDLGASATIHAVPLNNATIKAEDQKAVDEFNKQVAEMRRVSSMTQRYYGDLMNKLKFIKAAYLQTPKLPLSVNTDAMVLEERLKKAGIEMNGDQTKSSREFETEPGINSRVFSIIGSLWDISGGPTGTMLKTFKETDKDLDKVVNEINAINEEISKMEILLEKAGAPYTPGRMPSIKRP